VLLFHQSCGVISLYFLCVVVGEIALNMRGRSYSYSPSPPRHYSRRRRSPSPRGRYRGRDRDLPTSLLVRNLHRDCRYSIIVVVAVLLLCVMGIRIIGSLFMLHSCYFGLSFVCNGRSIGAKERATGKGNVLYPLVVHLCII